MTRATTFAALSAVGALCCVLGWIGWIAGPRALVGFGAAGFVCGVVGHVLSTSGELPRTGSWLSLRPAVRRVSLVAGLLAIVSMALMFAGAWAAGVADFPALESRPLYELNSHGVRTAVPRWRYVLVSMALGTGWHAMALLANMSAMSRKLYGEDLLVRGRRTRG
jgi:hypothetical protein